MKSPLTPFQVLLILLIVPAATFGLLELIQPDKGSLLLGVVLIPVVALVWNTARAFLGLFS